MRRALLAASIIGLATQCALAAAPATQPATDRQWAVTIRDPYLHGLGADNVWAAAKSIGIHRVECVLDEQLALPHLFEKDGTPYRIDTPENRDALNKKLKEEGMSIGCMALVVRLSKPGDVDKAVDWTARAAKAAPQVGCHMLMLPIGITDTKGGQVSDQLFVAIGKDFLTKLDKVAAETDIQLCIENLGVYWNRPEILVPILQASKPNRVGLLHDVCNMYWYGHPLEKLYSITEQIAPEVRCVHVKSVKYPVDKRDVQRTPGWEYGKYAEPVRTGDIDFARVMGIYAKAGYVGDVCIEDDSLGKFDEAGKKKVLADDVVLLKEIIAMLPKSK